MTRNLRLGTRDSKLALWQAQYVKSLLMLQGNAVELVPIKSEGDIQLDKPLYELGITGIFTKALDQALLRNEIDIAVHSFKDVPTQLPHGLTPFAILERENPADILISASPFSKNWTESEITIATSSLRRKAQWLNRHPHHKVVDIRGNVHTRLEKLHKNPHLAAIVAFAGLKRLNLVTTSKVQLNWMIPAPAQGSLVLVGREEDAQAQQICRPLNHELTALCVLEERKFLRELEGGCSAPIGAWARIKGGKFTFEGVLLSPDGRNRLYLKEEVSIKEVSGFGAVVAKKLLEKGARNIIDELPHRHL